MSHFQIDGVMISGGGSRLQILESGDLVLSQAVRSDSGLYMCVATNTLDTTNASATLTVYGTYPIIKQSGILRLFK